MSEELYNVTIYLKGGQTVELRANKFSAKTMNNDLTTLSWELDGNKKLLYIRMDDVSMILSNQIQ